LSLLFKAPTQKADTHPDTHTHVDSFVGVVNNKSKPANGWARYIFIGCGWPPGGGQWTRAPPGFRHAPDFRQRRPPAGCAENWTRDDQPASACTRQSETRFSRIGSSGQLHCTTDTRVQSGTRLATHTHLPTVAPFTLHQSNNRATKVFIVFVFGGFWRL
jgi:hypothetical protein